MKNGWLWVVLLKKIVENSVEHKKNKSFTITEIKPNSSLDMPITKLKPRHLGHVIKDKNHWGRLWCLKRQSNARWLDVSTEEWACNNSKKQLLADNWVILCPLGCKQLEVMEWLNNNLQLVAVTALLLFFLSVTKIFAISLTFHSYRASAKGFLQIWNIETAPGTMFHTFWRAIAEKCLGKQAVQIFAVNANGYGR